ncbi:hypothetical protein C8R46DRAFT_1035828 [Mycena filopes]|nr:hypothetical protein C8R46DRAFT_1035828 [Mycena filopes]
MSTPFGFNNPAVSDPRFANDLHTHNQLSRLKQYAMCAVLVASFEWVCYKTGHIVREKRLTPFPNSATPVEADAAIIVVGMVSDVDPKVSTIGNHNPRFADSAAKSKYTMVLERPNNNPVWAEVWDRSMPNLHALEGLICDGAASSYFFGHDGTHENIKVTTSLNLEQLPAVLVPSTQQSVFAEAAKDHVIRVLPVFDVDDRPLAPGQVAQVLPGCLVRVSIRMVHYNIKRDGKSLHAITGDIVEVVIMERGRPRAAPVARASRPAPLPSATGPLPTAPPAQQMPVWNTVPSIIPVSPSTAGPGEYGAMGSPSGGQHNQGGRPASAAGSRDHDAGGRAIPNAGPLPPSAFHGGGTHTGSPQQAPHQAPLFGPGGIPILDNRRYRSPTMMFGDVAQQPALFAGGPAANGSPTQRVNLSGPTAHSSLSIGSPMADTQRRAPGPNSGSGSQPVTPTRRPTPTPAHFTMAPRSMGPPAAPGMSHMAQQPLPSRLGLCVNNPDEGHHPSPFYGAAEQRSNQDPPATPPNGGMAGVPESPGRQQTEDYRATNATRQDGLERAGERPSFVEALQMGQGSDRTSMPTPQAGNGFILQAPFGGRVSPALVRAATPQMQQFTLPALTNTSGFELSTTPQTQQFTLAPIINDSGFELSAMPQTQQQFTLPPLNNNSGFELSAPVAWNGGDVILNDTRAPTPASDPYSTSTWMGEYTEGPGGYHSAAGEEPLFYDTDSGEGDSTGSHGSGSGSTGEESGGSSDSFIDDSEAVHPLDEMRLKRQALGKRKAHFEDDGYRPRTTRSVAFPSSGKQRPHARGHQLTG